MVIIGKRSESKEKTRRLLLEKTALLLYNKGFLNVSSKDISQDCDLSQGTLFLHFGTKENLFTTILNDNIRNLEKDLKQNCKIKNPRETFLKSFLDVIIDYESFLSRTYKDLAYLSDKLKKNLEGLENLIKSMFFDNLKENPAKKQSIVDTFIAIDAFLAQIHVDLVEKEVYSEHNSIIRQRRGKLIKLYRTLFE